MADNQSPLAQQIFSAGPALPQTPVGKVEREAINALRGYAYQIAVSALAWLELAGDERLYLEVAEDYAVCAADAINAVQVKDTAQTGSVTINSDDVKQALSSFVSLIADNPTKRITFRFLTTSRTGLEKSLADRPEGEAALSYWRSAALSKNVAPLRALLMRDGMPESVRSFVTSKSDEQLRTDLLQPIHWDCQVPDMTGVLDELEQVVAKVGRERFGLAATAAKQAANAVLFAVLNKAVLKDRQKRFLTSADLDTVLDGASRVSVRQIDFDRLSQLSSLTMSAFGEAGQLAAPMRAPWIILNSEMMSPSLLVQRTAIADSIRSGLVDSGCVVLAGATGLGKTLLARQLAAPLNKPSALIDFRDLSPAETKHRLDTLFVGLHGLRVGCVIFDDLNHLEQPSVKSAFAKVRASLKQRDLAGIVTCYRAPSGQLSSDVGLSSGSVFEVPYFSDAEVDALVTLAGGNPNPWGKIAKLAGGGGHPQLVMAFVLGAAARNWQQSELSSVIMSGFSSPDTEASREEARRRLIAGLPDIDQSLLFRLSLKIGPFERGLAMALGAVLPKLNQAGKVLDGLAGSWVEILDGKRFRVSPLIHNSGAAVLDTDELRRVHSAIARYLVKDHKISISDADALFAHAMLGEDDAILVVFARATMDAKPAALEALAEYCISFVSMQTEKTLFPKSPAVSALMRLAQCRVLVAKPKPERVDAAVDALFREIDNMDEPGRSSMEAIALLNLCMVQSIAGAVTRWFELLKRFREVIEREKFMTELAETVKPPMGHEDRTIVGTCFLLGLMRLPTVARLEKIFHELDALDEADREFYLADCDKYPSDYDLIVSNAWLNEERNSTLNWSDAADRYLGLARMAQSWGKTVLAAYCFKSRAVMIDEYGNDRDAALTAVAEARSEIGDNAILVREEIKIFWRAKQDQKVLELIKPIELTIAHDQGSERMFVMREAAISAARVGDWPLSARWFAEARAAASGNPVSKPTAIGFLADEAMAEYNAGNFQHCLDLLGEALNQLKDIEKDQSLKSIYTQHIIRHACLWVKTHALKEEDMGLPFTIMWEPGTGSNMEPLEVIRSKPLGPIDLTWYLLAEAEIALGVDGEITKTLPGHLRNGSIRFLDFTLRKAVIDAAVLRFQPRQFAKAFHPFLEGMEYLHSMSHLPIPSRFNVMSPERGSVPVVRHDALVGKATAEAAAASAILAFAVRAALKGQFDLIHNLELELASELGSSFVGRGIFLRFRGEGTPTSELGETVVRIFGIMRGESHLIPQDVTGVGLRFSEFAYGAEFKTELLPVLHEWFAGQWRRILDRERFRLQHPTLSVPEIENALGFDGSIEQRLAALLLATAEATEIPLSQAYKDLLAERTKPRPKEDDTLPVDEQPK